MPLAGTKISGASGETWAGRSPSRFSPARAITRASYSPASSLPTGVHVAADGLDAKVGALGSQQDVAAQARGPHHCPGLRAGAHPNPADQTSLDLPAAGSREAEPVRQLGRHVLEAVDAEVHTAGEQRFLDLVHEKGLAPEVGQRHSASRSPEVRW